MIDSWWVVAGSSKSSMLLMCWAGLVGLAAQRQKDERKERESGGPCRGSRAQPSPLFFITFCVHIWHLQSSEKQKKKRGKALLLGMAPFFACSIRSLPGIHHPWSMRVTWSGMAFHSIPFQCTVLYRTTTPACLLNRWSADEPLNEARWIPSTCCSSAGSVCTPSISHRPLSALLVQLKTKKFSGSV